jgi:hypothetical protein
MDRQDGAVVVETAVAREAGVAAIGAIAGVREASAVAPGESFPSYRRWRRRSRRGTSRPSSSRSMPW